MNAAIAVAGGMPIYGIRCHARTRIRRFVHEAYHHDSHLNSLRANDMPGCRGWECGSEIKVERAADRFFMQMWEISKFNEDGN